MSTKTMHGDNIADQIQSSDAYGSFNVLTLADVWNIVDNLHTHFCDHKIAGGRVLPLLEKMMDELEKLDSDLPPY